MGDLYWTVHKDGSLQAYPVEKDVNKETEKPRNVGNLGGNVCMLSEDASLNSIAIKEFQCDKSTNK